MSRVVNANNPGQARNQMLRTLAEALRRLSQKTDLDGEAKDMVATILTCLREIEDGIEASAAAWEKRDYWLKAEQLRQRWGWAGHAAVDLESMIRREDWDRLPGIMAGLFPYVAEIKITKFTRSPEEWAGSYARLRERLHL